MRFRATLERDALLLLLNTVTSMEKISDDAVLYLTAEAVRISPTSPSIDAIRCFCEIQSCQIFSDYRINSNSNDTMLLQLSLSHLSKALNSGKNALVCMLKLVKQDNLPFLRFEAKASGGLTIDIVHDIPIQILKASEIIHYLPPTDIPPPTVALKLSRCKVMKNIIDRMKNFSKSVELVAYQTGRIIFRVNSSCLINTYINGLQPFFGTLDEQQDRNNVINVTVDNRKLYTLFNIPQLHSNPSLICKFVIFIFQFIIIIIIINDY